MDDTKEILRDALSFVKKYRIVLLSMLLSAVVIICGVKGFAYKSEAKVYETEAKRIIEMMQNITKYYQTRPSYWGLSTATVINQNLYAQNMKTENGKLLNVWGKPVEAGADEHGNVVMPGAKNFVISYNMLNKKQCIGIGSQKFNKSFWLKVTSISIKNNLNSQEFVWGDKEYGLPIPAKKLRDLCKNDENSIIIHL